MAEHESITRVMYQALADFSNLHKEAALAVADLDAIKRKEEELNAASAASAAGSKAASATRVKGIQDETSAVEARSKALEGEKAATEASTVATTAKAEATKVATAAEKEAAAAVKNTADETKKLTDKEKESSDSKKAAQSATKALSGDIGGLGRALLSNIASLFGHKKALDENTKSTVGFRAGLSKLMTDLKDAQLVSRGAEGAFLGLGKAFGAVLTSGNGRGGMAPFALIFPLILGILGVVGPLVAGLSAAGIAVLGLASNLGTLSGVLVAAPAGILSYVSALLVLRESFKGIGTALTAFNALQNGTGTLKAYELALSKLTPAQQEFLKWLESMRGAWQNFKDTVSGNFFAQFLGDLNKVPAVFQIITTIMGKTAAAVGSVVDGFIRMAATPGFANLLTQFGTTNQDTIRSLGKVFMDLLDIIMKVTAASAPFIHELNTSLVSMANNLDAIVTKAASNGSLAAWLKDVYANLHLWWGIITDIAKTILNYSTAAQAFSLWITQGLKSVTDSWLKASEAAMKPGSAFKEWLSNIEPVVSALATTVGDLLHWWNTTSANPSNIAQMLKMLNDINQNLGPALGHLLQTMAQTDIAPALIHLISDLVSLIDTLSSNGGAEALASVLGFLVSIVNFLTDLSKLPGAGSLLVTVTTSLVTISALSFVSSKFAPLMLLIQALFGLSGKEGAISNIFKSISGVSVKQNAANAVKAAATGTDYAAAGGGVVAGALRTVPIIGATLAAGKGVQDAAPGIISSMQDFAKAGGVNASFSSNKKTQDRANTDIGNVVGETILPAGLRGAVDFFAPGLGAGIKKNVSSFAKGSAGAEEDTIKNVGSFVGDTAKNVGNFAKDTAKNVGSFASDTAKNAGNVAKGGADFISGIPKALENGGKQISTFFTKTIPGLVKGAGDLLWKGLGSIGKWLGDQWKAFLKWLHDLPRNIGFAAGYIWGSLENIGKWLGNQWKLFVKWLGTLGPAAVKLAGDIWTGIKGMGAWLGKVWDGFVKWLGSLPGWVVKTAGDIWTGMVNMGAWLAKVWAGFVKWLSGLPGWVVKTAGDIWTGMVNMGAWLATVWSGFLTWLQGLPKQIANAAVDLWSGMQDIGGWLADMAGKVVSWAAGLPQMVANAIGNLFSMVTGGFSAGVTATGNTKHDGGMIFRAGGGFVPGEGDHDTVPAMLTPGEIVIRKSVVNAIGPENLLALNSGLVSYQQLLSNAMANAGSPKTKSDMSSLGSGLTGYSPSVSPTTIVSTSGPAQLERTNAAGAKSGVHIQNLNVLNPIPETTSDSLPRTLRKISYLSTARG